MLICYTLTMPGNNSWNGKWSGDGDLYCIVRKYGKKAGEKRQAIIGKYHSYNFGDGWRAAVTVKEVTPAEARKLRKASRGFCGYDWMVDSLERWGGIYSKPPEPVAVPSTTTLDPDTEARR